ncbi:MAG: RNA polymerase sigma-54 factor [Rhodospirillales bacterium]|nr:MAG: RNA polymerase sigma-54 factor [Rhodospirillales bacterium]
MVLAPRLDLRQSQTLVMTPQLQQAIKLLQLSNIELAAYVEQELERNPLLEQEDANQDQRPVELEGRGDEDVRRDVAEPLVDTAPGTEESQLDVEVDNQFNNDGASDNVEEGWQGSWEGRGGRADFLDDESDLAQTVASQKSLRDHLIDQLNLDVGDAGDRMIGLHLIDMLNEAGWLSGDIAEVATRLDCEPTRVESVLFRLQSFDPPGIFARGLKECLALQLKDKDRLDPAMQALLDNLEMLARRDMAGLMKICGVDGEDLAEMIGEIRALDPKPALAFDHEITQAVVPDVLMRPLKGGGWVVELNNDTLPRVLINTRYHAEISKRAKKREDKQFIAERFQSANWLVKSLHQRATTILKVATEIVRQQEGFFEHGVAHLRPLVLRDIANVIGMHESTVSRVTSNKYISSPRGIYELKYFFTQAIASAEGGDAHSAESVRHRIMELIDAEAPGDILSDDKLVDILKKEGVDIARRTVAKYRESLKIASSVQRRREKSIGL